MSPVVQRETERETEWETVSTPVTGPPGPCHGGLPNLCLVWFYFVSLVFSVVERETERET